MQTEEDKKFWSRVARYIVATEVVLFGIAYLFSLFDPTQSNFSSNLCITGVLVMLLGVTLSPRGGVTQRSEVDGSVFVTFNLDVPPGFQFSVIVASIIAIVLSSVLDI